MRTVLASLTLLIILIAGPVWAQQSCLTDSSQGEVISTMRVAVNLGGSGKHSNTVALEVMVLRTRDGMIQYSINPGSFRFYGDPLEIDKYSTRDIFRLAEQAAIARGIMEGYTECTPDCKAVTVRVCQAACVSRSGSGLETKFESCDPTACCVRTYQVCCPDGSGTPVTRLVAIEGGQCGVSGADSGDCESICW